MERALDDWERATVEALVSVDGPTAGPDPVLLRDSLPHLVVTGGCDCGRPSFDVRDRREREEDRPDGHFHYSDATSEDGTVQMFLLVKGNAPSSVDVILGPDVPSVSGASRPDPRRLSVSAADHG